MPSSSCHLFLGLGRIDGAAEGFFHVGFFFKADEYIHPDNERMSLNTCLCAICVQCNPHVLDCRIRIFQVTHYGDAKAPFIKN